MVNEEILFGKTHTGVRSCINIFLTPCFRHGATIKARTQGEKRLDLGRPHVARMPLAVVQDETPNPLNILRFRADAVILGANPLAHLVEQFG